MPSLVKNSSQNFTHKIKMLHGIHHAAIICSDYAKSKHFYLSILGLELVAENYRAERASYKLDLKLADGSQIELFSFQNPPLRANYPEAQGLRHLAFSVQSINDTVAHLAAHGVTCEPIRQDEYTGKQYTFFHDPDGLPLELYESEARHRSV